jgi:CPA2 family monovalent cation:H+ antiporter-2
MPPQPHDVSFVFLELGATIVGLAILARVATRWGFSAIPLYLIAGLAFGNGGFLPLNLSEGFVRLGAEIGVLLLLFMLGLEYTGKELGRNLRAGLPGGAVDFLLNFTPGIAAGLLLGWKPLASVLLGGVTWISSSGVIAKVLTELKRLDNPETPRVLTVLVLEDLAMAVYLPLVAVLLGGGEASHVAKSIAVALAAAGVVLYVAVRHGDLLSGWLEHESDEVVLLSTLGVVLVVAGAAQRLQVSAAVGAFLVGVAISGPLAKRSHHLLSPLRDLFAATFFFFFGMEIDPASLPPVAVVAIILGIVTALTKILTGYWVAGRDLTRQERLRAGAALVARGEFSIVIAGLGTTLEPALGPVAAAYVLLMAVLGPVLARVAK